ncbi:hypothetical protein CY35_16G089200 [Sphagnum magellanicum]|nr:hypothetical protein CY35_16G089200 [Sphagnum magellanicum]
MAIVIPSIMTWYMLSTANANKGWKTIRIKQLLADIYYPYIHLDYGTANSSLSFPIQFEVNGQNLVEVMDCEFGITDLHSGNGDPFLIDLELTAFTDDPAVGAWSRAQNKEKAHAQIQCQYFPNQKGKEMLDTILEELAGQGLTSKTFESMPRVAVRWLGRLLPDNNWMWMQAFILHNPRHYWNAIICLLLH